MARADDRLRKAERNALAGAIEQLQLPEKVTLQTLLVESMQIDELLPQIETPLAQDIVYQSAYTLAHIDGEYHPQEEQLLTKIEQAFPDRLFWKGKKLFNRLLEETGQASFATQVKYISNAAERDAAVEGRIVSWAAVSAIAGAFAIAEAQIAADLLVYLNQLHLIQEVGTLWGYGEQDTTHLRRAILGGLGNVGIRIALGNLTRLLPGFGPEREVTDFTTTYAIGKAAHRYFSRGTVLEVEQLQQAFEAAKKAGKGVYEQHQDAIATRRAELEPQMQAIDRDREADRIPEDRYIAEVLGLAML